MYLVLGDDFRNCRKMNGSDIIAKNNKWVPIKREEVSLYLHKYKTTSPTIERIQFALTFLWARTARKVRSLSLSRFISMPHFYTL